MVIVNLKEQWPSGKDTGFPIQRSRVQNHWLVGFKVDSAFRPSEVDQMSTQSFWDLLVKS